MEFVFKVQEPRGIDVEIFVYVERVSVGRLLFTTDEWFTLRAMLIHGGGWYQDDEGKIVIEDTASVPAFVEGT
jgi:hypothetical protein